MGENEMKRWIDRYNQEFLDFIGSLTPEEKIIALKLFSEHLQILMGNIK
jgi:hypothetical protein